MKSQLLTTNLRWNPNRQSNLKYEFDLMTRIQFGNPNRICLPQRDNLPLVKLASTHTSLIQRYGWNFSRPWQFKSCNLDSSKKCCPLWRHLTKSSCVAILSEWKGHIAWTSWSLWQHLVMWLHKNLLICNSTHTTSKLMMSLNKSPP